MKRHPELQKLVDKFAETSFGRTETRAATDSVCVMCGAKVDPLCSFRDAISAKEYRISHTCQKCQDEIFGEED